MKFILTIFVFIFIIPDVPFAQSASPVLKALTIEQFSPVPIVSDGFKINVQNSSKTAQDIYSNILPPGSHEYDVVRSTMVVPVASLGQSNIYAYYGENHGVNAQLVGAWGIIKCLVNDAMCWDLNPTITDTDNNSSKSSFATKLVVLEGDVSVYNPGTYVCGICMTGSSAIQPAGADAFVTGDLHAASPGTIKWTHGFVVNDGTASIGLVVGSETLGQAKSKGIPSYYNFKGVDGVEHAVTLQSDASGAIEFNSTDAANGISLKPSIAGDSPVIYSFGSDPAPNLTLAAQGNGKIVIKGRLEAEDGIDVTGRAIFNTPIVNASYKRSALPKFPQPGVQAFCSDCRKPGEPPGAGHGMMVFADGSGAWFSFAGSSASK